jgi:hypothetical protein
VEGLTMTIEAMKQALEALTPWMGTDADHTEQHAAYHALRQAIEQAEQGVDWKRLYELEHKKKLRLQEMYERDIKPLTKIVPMSQPEQAQPVAIIASLMPAERNTLIEEGHSLHDALYTAPPPRKPLTDEQKLALLKKHFNAVIVPDWFDALLKDIEAVHGIKGEA